MTPILIGFWIAFCVAGVIAMPTLKLLIKLKSRQTISEFVAEHKAKQGTPTMGGVIVVLGASAAWLYSGIVTSSAITWAYLVLFLSYAMVGFVDDFVIPRVFTGKRGLGWKQKILLELVLSVLPFLFLPGHTWWSIGLGVLMILFYSNAYNFTDGLDGLAGSVGIALLTGLAALALISGVASFAIPLGCAVIAGGLIPFLWLNAPPAKMFMGDVGSLPIGAAIGLMAWQLSGLQLNRINPVMAVAITLISIVMYIELVPVPLQIASVKLRKGKRIFLMTPVHHGYQKKGIAETRIVGGYFIGQIVVTLLGVSAYVWLKPLFP